MKKNRLERENEENILNKNLQKFAEVQKLSKNWNPLPERGSSLPRLQNTVDRHSSFINCSQRYFNKGKYKGIFLKDTPQEYLKWVVQEIELNNSELKLIRKFIKK
jgi:hypothetical protein